MLDPVDFRERGSIPAPPQSKNTWPNNSHSDHIGHRVHKNLAVPDLPSIGCAGNGLDHFIHLRPMISQEVDGVEERRGGGHHDKEGEG